MKILIYDFTLAIFLLSSCTTKVQNYSVSTDNIVKLREFEGVKVGGGNFCILSSKKSIL
jgi:hypothetical protein